MSMIRPPLIELRQYALAPGKRERMIELFDRHFADAQDALGLPVLGQFRLAESPNVLVWIRGFADMASRPAGLASFYGGKVWSELGAEAIAYVTGFDNVRLLREAVPGSGVQVIPGLQPTPTEARLLFATTYSFGAPVAGDTLAACLAHARDGACLGTYVSEETPNNFPNLPIRESEHVFTWFSTTSTAPPFALAAQFRAEPEILRLEPTPRSALR